MRGLVGIGMSERYKLKNAGEMTPSCGTPILNIWVLGLIVVVCVALSSMYVISFELLESVGDGSLWMILLIRV